MSEIMNQTQEETTEEKKAETKEEKPKKEKLVKIILPLTKENQADVFVRVNQRTWLIKRGEEVEVPECVVEVIRNSEAMTREAIEYQRKKSKG